MIEIKNKYVSNRALGWSQDASDFRGLKQAVQIFDDESAFYKKFVKNILPLRISDSVLLSHFDDVLKRRPICISYKELVGSHTTPRKNSPCNGIMQAAIKGQSKPYLTDWAADSFVRWAHLCGFIAYNSQKDSFSITELGRKFSSTGNGSSEEKMVLIDALIQYPPVCRVLSLLEDGDVLTKFEIGRQLGFVGEDGFTSLPQNVLLSSLASTKSQKEKNEMLADWDGSSDKYARQICKWLEKLGLVKKQPKEFKLSFKNQVCYETIPQAYQITSDGLKALRKIKGVNKVKRVSKNVYWEMLCLKGTDRDYKRTRRGYLIKELTETTIPYTIETIVDRLGALGFTETRYTIEDDIKGLINLGLAVRKRNDGYDINDEINMVLPSIRTSHQESTYEQIKEKCREYCQHVPHTYLSLIDLSFNPQSNRQFEFEVIDLLTTECGFEGKHLGGARRPDGVIFTNNLSENFGFLVDTKAYSQGYSLPINQADEMTRYLRDNELRNAEINSTEWWSEFPNNICHFGFFFVSGKFQGSFRERLQSIALTTSIRGSVINAANLLFLAEDIKSNRLTMNQACNLFVCNDEIDFQQNAED